MYRSWLSRTIACCLSLMLLFSGIVLAGPTPSAEAEPKEASSQVPAAESLMSLAPSLDLHPDALHAPASELTAASGLLADTSKPPVFYSGSIPCTIYDSLDPEESHVATIANGIIGPGHVPLLARLYLCSCVACGPARSFSQAQLGRRSIYGSWLG